VEDAAYPGIGDIAPECLDPADFSLFVRTVFCLVISYFAANKILAFPVSNELWKNGTTVGAFRRCFTGEIG
jgi:hypothetical protein